MKFNFRLPKAAPNLFSVYHLFGLIFDRKLHTLGVRNVALLSFFDIFSLCFIFLFKVKLSLSGFMSEDQDFYITRINNSKSLS
jgi:hypothetical protein